MLFLFLINSVVGGGGGFLGQMIKKNGLGLLGNIIAGVIGGNAAPWLAGLAGLVGSSGGGLDIASIVTALVGGGAGSLIGGLLKKSPGGNE